MERLSSQRTFFLKRVFPVLWLGIFFFAMVMGAFHGPASSRLSFFLPPLIMVAFGAFLFWRLLWRLADEVSDGGTFLLVRRGGEEERVPFANVMNVSSSQFTNPRRITLRLRKPGKFGDEIAFLPKFTGIRWNPFARDAIAERLIVKVDRSRNQA